MVEGKMHKNVLLYKKRRINILNREKISKYLIFMQKRQLGRGNDIQLTK